MKWPPTIPCTTRSTCTAPAGFWCWPATGLPSPTLVWKDTVLVRTGETVDILFDVTNPGLWMPIATSPSTCKVA
jgi:Multicopper oxidase